MAKKNMDALLSNIMGDALVSITDRPTPPPPSESEEILASQPKAPGKEPRWRHFTFICSAELVDKVQAIAHKEGFTIRALMEYLISQGVESYEAKHGKVKKIRRNSVSDVL